MKHCCVKLVQRRGQQTCSQLFWFLKFIPSTSQTPLDYGKSAKHLNFNPNCTVLIINAIDFTTKLCTYNKYCTSLNLPSILQFLFFMEFVIRFVPEPSGLFFSQTCPLTAMMRSRTMVWGKTHRCTSILTAKGKAQQCWFFVMSRLIVMWVWHRYIQQSKFRRGEWDLLQGREKWTRIIHILLLPF